MSPQLCPLWCPGLAPRAWAACSGSPALLPLPPCPAKKQRCRTSCGLGSLATYKEPPLLRYCYGHPSKLIQGPQGPEFHVSTEAFVRKKSEPGPLAWASRLGLSPEPVPPGMLLMAEAGPGPNTAASSVSEGRQLGAVLGLRLEQAPQGVGCGPCSPFIVQHPVRGPGGCGQHLRSAWGAERPMAGRGVLSHRLVFSPIITLFPSSPIPTVSGEVGPAPTDECPFQLQLDSGFLLL